MKNAALWIFGLVVVAILAVAAWFIFWRKPAAKKTGTRGAGKPVDAVDTAGEGPAEGTGDGDYIPPESGDGGGAGGGAGGGDVEVDGGAGGGDVEVDGGDIEESTPDGGGADGDGGGSAGASTPGDKQKGKSKIPAASGTAPDGSAWNWGPAFGAVGANGKATGYTRASKSESGAYILHETFDASGKTLTRRVEKVSGKPHFGAVKKAK